MYRASLVGSLAIATTLAATLGSVGIWTLASRKSVQKSRLPPAAAPRQHPPLPAPNESEQEGVAETIPIGAAWEDVGRVDPPSSQQVF